MPERDERDGGPGSGLDAAAPSLLLLCPFGTVASGHLLRFRACRCTRSAERGSAPRGRHAGVERAGGHGHWQRGLWGRVVFWL